MDATKAEKGKNEKEDNPATIAITSTEESKPRFYCFLLFCCLLTYSGTQFSDIGILSAIQSQLIDYFNIDSLRYNLLNTVFALTIVPLSFIGGIIIDKIGLKRSLILYFAILAIGYFVSLLSGILASYALLLISRIIFGLGTESLQNTVAVLVNLYFDKSQLGIVYASLAIGAVFGAIASIILTLQVYHATSMSFVLFYPFILVCIASLLLIIFFSKPYQTRKNITIQSKNMNTTDLVDKFEFRYVKYLLNNKLFVMFLISSSIVAAANIAWFSVGVDMVSTGFNVNQDTATLVIGSPVLIYIVLVLGVGRLNDKYGYRAHTFVLCCVSEVFAFIIFTFARNNPLFAVIGVVFATIGGGLQYAMLNATVALIVSYISEVESETLKNVNIEGTAFGLMSSVRYLFSGIFSLMIGVLTRDNKDNASKYQYAMGFELVVVVIALVISVVMMKYDETHGQRLKSARGRSKNDSNNSDVDMDVTANKTQLPVETRSTSSL